MDLRPFTALLLLVGVAIGLPAHHPPPPKPGSLYQEEEKKKEQAAVADPDPCCVPTSHGNVSMLFGSIQAGSPPTAFSSMAAVFFDQENYKAAAHQLRPNPDDPSSSSTLSILVDYTGGLMYIAQPETKQCSTEQLPFGMMGTCIPDDDYQYLGRGNLGFGSDSQLTVDLWQVDGNEAGLDVQFQAWTTPKQCGLVQLNMWGDTGDAQIITPLGFYNMTAGVKDSSVFDVPSYCNGVSSQAKSASAPIKMSPLMHALKYKFILMNRVKNINL